MVIKIMKKIFILFVIVFSFVGCIDSLLSSKEQKIFYSETQNLIIDNPKVVYNVGDTLKMHYVYPNKFLGKKGRGEDDYYTDIHQTFPELEQELFTYTYEAKPPFSKLIKEGQEVDNYKETLLYDGTQNAYVSQPILLLLKKEGEYNFKDYILFKKGANPVPFGKDNISSIQMGGGITPDLIIKVEP